MKAQKTPNTSSIQAVLQLSPHICKLNGVSSLLCCHMISDQPEETVSGRTISFDLSR